MYGRIAEAIMETGVMNPIIVFDELDKVAENTRGAEIFNTLIHLTDFTQNHCYCDQYFGAGLPFDLSRCTFVFTYNDPSLIR
jgi:ATP-dependent Lon protease